MDSFICTRAGNKDKHPGYIVTGDPAKKNEQQKKAAEKKAAQEVKKIAAAETQARRKVAQKNIVTLEQNMVSLEVNDKASAANPKIPSARAVAPKKTASRKKKPLPAALKEPVFSDLTGEIPPLAYGLILTNKSASNLPDGIKPGSSKPVGSESQAQVDSSLTEMSDSDLPSNANELIDAMDGDQMDCGEQIRFPMCATSMDLI